MEEIPNLEGGERYRIEVWDEDTLIRTATVTAPHWTYTGADQSTDGASGQIWVQVAQVSETYGAGLFRGMWVDLNGG